MERTSHLDDLNDAQRAAVLAGIDATQPLVPGPPLLIIAGAGSGKTLTLAHRVAHLVLRGADPGRILLLTFTRRAAEAMVRRVERICGQALGAEAAFGGRLGWAGTFHAVGARLLREYAPAIGLDPAFTILDRSDAADLLDLLRSEHGQARTDRRFPKKATCLAIYSHAVNAQAPLEVVLQRHFPWCAEWAVELRRLFAAYVGAKQRQAVLDYDDLLLWWSRMLEAPALATDMGRRFDHLLVDEYQDTNRLQEAILLALKPEGRGVTVVGDDAQAIYAFRAATVRNILGFPNRFAPPAEMVKLERNYRSTQPILAAANAVIGLAAERYAKELFSTRHATQRPLLAMVRDDLGQAEQVAEQVLAHREAGLALREQAVLFRTASHSAALELELGRRRIPYVKYGGLRFLEAAHIKDVLAFLRWAENPRDRIAAFRALQLLPGIGPGIARRLLEASDGDVGALAELHPPRAAADLWPGLVGLLRALALAPWPVQPALVRGFYDPLLADRYDAVAGRRADLDQLERLAAASPSRERFLTDLTLDPPDAVGGAAGPPRKDEDHLILSTIHSAKGQEWRAVYILNLVDGCIPSDMATGDAEGIEEERRLLYVAMTRARDHLCLLQPERFYVTAQATHGDRHVRAPRTRFIPNALLGYFDLAVPRHHASPPGQADAALPKLDLAATMRKMWE